MKLIRPAYSTSVKIQIELKKQDDRLCMGHFWIWGGLVIQRHNEIRDALGDLASIAYQEVVNPMTKKMFLLWLLIFLFVVYGSLKLLHFLMFK